MPFKDKETRKKYQREWWRKRRLVDPTYGNQWIPSKEVRKQRGAIWGRRWSLKAKYGITPEEYERMFQDQNGLCAVCKRPEIATDHKGGPIRRLSVDHDHITNEVRSLLCCNCNQALGKFQDDILILESALEYLRKY